MISALLILACCQATMLHTSETQTSMAASQSGRKFSDLELQQFGDRCNKLPYVLWNYTLDFLLGPYHDVRYTISPDIVDRWHIKENQLALDDCGRLISRYKNSIYSWISYAEHEWKAHKIEPEWSFDKCDNGSIVLVDSDHARIKTLDDASFKEQAEYKINYDETYFLTAQRGKMLIHTKHPLSWNNYMSGGIKNLMVTKFDTSHALPMPEDGVMPPIVVDQNGLYLAAHASTTDRVYTFNIISQQLMSTITLSARSVASIENMALWEMIHPKTGEHKKACIMKQDDFVFFTAKCSNIRSPDSSSSLNFLQQGGVVNCMRFIHARKIPLLATAHTDLSKTNLSNVINTWEIESGKQISACTRAMEQAGFTREELSRSGRLVTNNKCDGFDFSTSRDGSPLRPLIPQQEAAISSVLISPSGDWVLCKSYSKDGEKQLKPLAPQLCYLGGERMKRIQSEDPKIDRRKFMMRLYSLQRASELGTHVQPPREMQEKLDS